MFTIEIKINGSLIGHIYGINKGDGPNKTTRYNYEYYEPEIRRLITGSVLHKRENGIRVLIELILESVENSLKKHG